jgi:hypothetical protein
MGHVKVTRPPAITRNAATTALLAALMTASVTATML